MLEFIKLLFNSLFETTYLSAEEMIYKYTLKIADNLNHGYPPKK